LIKEELINNRKVKIEGFGIFTPYMRKSYIGKSVDGNIEEIPTTKYISFRPSKSLKQ
jgi:nucleoid DNA-binding protein